MNGNIISQDLTPIHPMSTTVAIQIYESIQSTRTACNSSGPSDTSKRLLPWLMAVAFFMESLDTMILNTAALAISAALHVTPLSMKAIWDAPGIRDCDWIVLL
jgi:hypothetical protein